MQQNIELGDPGIDPMENSAAPAKTFQIQRLLVFLHKFWWVPVITVILALTAAILYLRSLPPTFVSKARMIENGKMTIPTGSYYTEDLQNYVGTQIELLRSQKMRELALVRLRAVNTNQNAVPLDKDGLPAVVKINVAQAPKSSVFVIDATSVNGEYSRNYLDALMGQYLAYKRELRKKASMDTLASLNSEVTRLELKLQEDQAKYAEYQKTNNLAVLQEEDRMAGSYLSTLKMKLSELKLDEQMTDANIERGQKPIGAYTPPKSATAKLVARKEDLQLQKTNILVSIKEMEAKVTEANARIMEVERFKGEIARTQNQYDRFITLYQNLETSRNIDQETIDVLEPASAPLPASKQDVAMAAGGAIGGLILGLGIIFLIALIDDRFISIDEVTEKLGNGIVGQVPDVIGVKRNSPLPLLHEKDERHMYAESYRNLRSALYFMAPEGARSKIVLITSAVPNEGKSTIAANLARTLALGGARVLLVDGDMRRGVLHELMGLQRGPGLAELLRKPGDLSPFIQFDTLPNLSFISSGGSLTNPGDLLWSPVCDQIFAAFRQQFDYVLIDSCPVFAADDATTLAPKADATLFVVRRGFSRARPVREALELLNQRQAKVIGVIFNRANSSSRSYYYYNHADYYTLAKTA